jgi:hypothetical protein
MNETTASTDTTHTDPDPTQQRPLLRVVKGDATPEEVAALVAVFAALRTEEPPARRPAPAWAAPHRKVRRTLPHGPGGWRASALPR